MTDKATQALRSMIDWDKAREINYREEYGQHLEQATKAERRAEKARSEARWTEAKWHYEQAAYQFAKCRKAARAAGDEIAVDDSTQKIHYHLDNAEEANDRANQKESTK